MPIRWDDRAHTTLLHTLIEQNPKILSGVNSDDLAAAWPGPEKPTARAITEQLAKLRKKLKIPGTPGRRSTGNVPRTPKTPTTQPTTPFTKRSNTSAHNDSSNKKRKRNKKRSDTESEEALDLTSSADDVDNIEEETDDELSSPSRVPATRIKRELPARSKSRNKSYLAEPDSAGEDDCAKDPYSEEDAEFSLEAMEQGKGKTKLKKTRAGIEKEYEREAAEGDESEDGEVKEEPEAEDDTDMQSEVTGWSHQTFYSAHDCIA